MPLQKPRESERATKNKAVPDCLPSLPCLLDRRNQGAL